MFDRIPKWILHPTLLISAGIAMFWLTRTGLPSKPDGVAKILAFDHGKLSLENQTGTWQFEDLRFSKVDDAQSEALKSYFVGKYVQTQSAQNGVISLPVDLYDASCFSMTKPNKQACPMQLTK